MFRRRHLLILATLIALAAGCDKKYPPAGDAEPEEVDEPEAVEDPGEDPVEEDVPDPIPDHPRIWLTPELLSALELRQETSTPNAVTIRDWCADHGEDDLDSFVDSRGLGVLGAVNYALLYQIQGAPTYAQRALQIVEHALSNPYTGYTADTWIEFDDWYTARNLVPAVAMVLDWCWDAMTESRRANLVSQLDAWASRIMSAEPPGWRDPSSASFHGLAWALLSAGYAIWGHSPDAETYISHARNVMVAEGMRYASCEEVAWPVWDNTTGRACGGLWNSGTSQGSAASELLFSSLLAMRSAESIYFTDFTFPDEHVALNIHATLPDASGTHAEGDGSAGAIGPSTRIPVLMAMQLAGVDARGRGQHWVDGFTSRTTAAYPYRLFTEFIWYDGDIEALDYTTGTDTAWFATGAQTLLWRSGWGSDATWMAFRMGMLNTDHAHNGLSSFVIYRGGYLVADEAVESSDTTLYEDAHHNVLYIPPADESDEGRLYWGATSLDRLSLSMASVYLSGDMTDVYTSQPESRANTVAFKEREFFLVAAERTLLVMDRGASFDAAHDKIFQLFMGASPTASGDDHRVSSGAADLIVHTAYPPGATSTVDATGVPRLRVATGDASLAKSFLHLLRVTDPAGSLGLIPLAIGATEVIGTAFTSTDSTADIVVTFSSDPEGDPPSDTTWTITFDHAGSLVRCYFIDLVPGMTYYVDHVLTGTSLEITVSTTPLGTGSAHPASTSGIVSFEFTTG